jgi:hypothetical protein
VDGAGGASSALFACAAWPASWRNTAWPGGQNGVLQLRQAMFERLLASRPGPLHHQTASQLTNTLVYEVQQGTTQLIGALLTLVRTR